jgi:hypothetical protein
VAISPPSVTSNLWKAVYPRCRAGPQNPGVCHLYLAEGCHLYIARQPVVVDDVRCLRPQPRQHRGVVPAPSTADPAPRGCSAVSPLEGPFTELLN